ncbi:MAG: copper chaperone PCu(A)C [Rhizobiales bacterium]|nr:copper chaperone PCu(A)C [Hyphomicrobiales bacterium]
MQLKVCLIAASVCVFTAGKAGAHDYKFGSLEIVHPWVRATPKGASVAGGYLKITNRGPAPDRLIGGSAAFAGRLQLHEMKMSADVMQMRPLKDGLEIKPGETVEFKPGSFHIMFFDLKQPLQKDERVKGTLVFEKAGTIELEFIVEGLGSVPSGAPATQHGH